MQKNIYLGVYTALIKESVYFWVLLRAFLKVLLNQ